MLSDQAKRDCGTILFNMMATGMEEVKAKMAFESFDACDSVTQGNYFKVVDKLVEIIEGRKEPVKIEEPVVTESAKNEVH